MATNNKNHKLTYLTGSEDESFHPFFNYRGKKIWHDPEIYNNTENLELFLNFMDGLSESYLDKVFEIVLCNGYYENDVNIFYNSKMDRSNFAGLKTSKSDEDTIYDTLELDSNGQKVKFQIIHFVLSDLARQRFSQDNTLPKVDWGSLPNPKPDKLDMPDKYKWPGKPKPSIWGERDTSGPSLWDEVGK
jgi:hypothetical protein